METSETPYIYYPLEHSSTKYFLPPGLFSQFNLKLTNRGLLGTFSKREILQNAGWIIIFFLLRVYRANLCQCQFRESYGGFNLDRKNGAFQSCVPAPCVKKSRAFLQGNQNILLFGDPSHREAACYLLPRFYFVMAEQDSKLQACSNERLYDIQRYSTILLLWMLQNLITNTGFDKTE